VVVRRRGTERKESPEVVPEKPQADEKAKPEDYSIKGLYRGLSTNLGATMASYAIYFWWHSLF
jgi:hypothetical protein